MSLRPDVRYGRESASIIGLTGNLCCGYVRVGWSIRYIVVGVGVIDDDDGNDEKTDGGNGAGKKGLFNPKSDAPSLAYDSLDEQVYPRALPQPLHK